MKGTGERPPVEEIAAYRKEFSTREFRSPFFKFRRDLNSALHRYAVKAEYAVDLLINRKCLKTRTNSISNRFLCAGCVPEVDLRAGENKLRGP